MIANLRKPRRPWASSPFFSLRYFGPLAGRDMNLGVIIAGSHGDGAVASSMHVP